MDGKTKPVAARTSHNASRLSSSFVTGRDLQQCRRSTGISFQQPDTIYPLGTPGHKYFPSGSGLGTESRPCNIGHESTAVESKVWAIPSSSDMPGYQFWIARGAMARPLRYLRGRCSMTVEASCYVPTSRPDLPLRREEIIQARLPEPRVMVTSFCSPGLPRYHDTVRSSPFWKSTEGLYPNSSSAALISAKECRMSPERSSR